MRGEGRGTKQNLERGAAKKISGTGRAESHLPHYRKPYGPGCGYFFDAGPDDRYIHDDNRYMYDDNRYMHDDYHH